MNSLLLDRYEANGNDFAIALLKPGEHFSLKASLGDFGLGFDDLARAVCDRDFGVRSGVGYVHSSGADGLLVGVHGSSEDEPGYCVRMHLWNADGSSAEISGNGLACLASAVFKDDPAEAGDVLIETDAGMQRCIVDPRNFWSDGLPNLGPIRLVKVFMPKVGHGPEIPLDLKALIRGDFGCNLRHFDTGDVGNPHLVIALARPPVDIPAAVSPDDAAELGKQLGARVGELGRCYEEFFPAGINIEFIWPDPFSTQRHDGVVRELMMAVWERGAGLTVACGSGAVVAGTLAHRWGFVSSVADLSHELGDAAGHRDDLPTRYPIALNTAPFPGYIGKPIRYRVFAVPTEHENHVAPELRVMAGRVAAGIQFPLDAVLEHAEHFAGSG